MTVPGKSITVARSVVTGIRIQPETRNAEGVLLASPRLVIEGVDQDAEGRTLRSHTQTYSEGDELAGAILEAVYQLTAFAQIKIDAA